MTDWMSLLMPKVAFLVWVMGSVGACVDTGEDGEDAPAPRDAEASYLQDDLRLFGTPSTPFGIVGAVVFGFRIHANTAS